MPDDSSYFLKQQADGTYEVQYRNRNISRDSRNKYKAQEVIQSHKKLVYLANKELKSANLIYHEKLDHIDLELGNVNARLDKLYDILETGKLGLDELAPRIKQLKNRQDELSKAGVMIEAEIATRGVEPLSVAKVKDYVHDLMALLTETDIIRSKSFLRSFIENIVIHGTEGKIYYKLPVPPDGKRVVSVGVLPIDTPGGAGGVRTPYLLRAKQAFSQLNYGPGYRKLYHTLSFLATLTCNCYTG
jgi:site-specific DNA recombinase